MNIIDRLQSPAQASGNRSFHLVPGLLSGSRLLCAGLIGLFLSLLAAPVQAETCRKQVINNQEVTICCDANGNCYRR
jgi:hypothetical protein